MLNEMSVLIEPTDEEPYYKTPTGDRISLISNYRVDVKYKKFAESYGLRVGSVNIGISSYYYIINAQHLSCFKKRIVEQWLPSKGIYESYKMTDMEVDFIYGSVMRHAFQYVWKIPFIPVEICFRSGDCF